MTRRCQNVTQEAVLFLDMIDSVLVGEWEGYKDFIPPYTDSYEAYIDAEFFSLKASQDVGSLETLVQPLTKLKDKGALSRLWKNIDSVSCQALLLGSFCSIRGTPQGVREYQRFQRRRDVAASR